MVPLKGSHLRNWRKKFSVKPDLEICVDVLHVGDGLVPQQRVHAHHYKIANTTLQIKKIFGGSDSPPIPGVQKPHWLPWPSASLCCTACRRPPAPPMPWKVVATRVIEEQTDKVTYFFWCDQSSFRMGQFFTCISGWWSIMIYLSPQLWWRPGHASPRLEQGRHWRCNRRIKSTLRPLSCLTRKVPNCYASLAFFAKFYFFRPRPTPHANKLHVVLLPLGISKFALYVF